MLSNIGPSINTLTQAKKKPHIKNSLQPDIVL